MARRRQRSPRSVRLPSSLCIIPCSSVVMLMRFHGAHELAGNSSAGQQWCTVFAWTCRPYLAASRLMYPSRRKIFSRSRLHLVVRYPSHIANKKSLSSHAPFSVAISSGSRAQAQALDMSRCWSAGIACSRLGSSPGLSRLGSASSFGARRSGKRPSRLLRSV